MQARVALALLEAVREQDRPGEVLDDENVSVTMPRRFGLSGVVETQIARYQQDARRRRRVPESEVRDLIRLVARRPDASEVFRQVGRTLGPIGEGPRWQRLLPRRAAFALTRRRVHRRLDLLFGGGFIRNTGAPFRLEALRDLLTEGSPGGESCSLVAGFAEVALESAGDGPFRIGHSTCRARGDARCTWTLVDPHPEPPQAASG